MSATQPQSGCKLDQFFKLTERGTTVRREVLAGLTTFLAMVYSVIVVPGMLGQAGFPHTAPLLSPILLPPKRKRCLMSCTGKNSRCIVCCR